MKGLAMSTTTLTKWGNSAGVIIPKVVWEGMGLSIGDQMEIESDGHSISMKPKNELWTLSSLMEGYDGEKPEFIDPGQSVGKEMW